MAAACHITAGTFLDPGNTTIQSSLSLRPGERLAVQIRDADSGLVVFERVTTETLDEDRQSVPGTLTPVGDLDLPAGSYVVSAVVLACGEASPCGTERPEREAYEAQGCAGEFSVGDAARAGLIVNPPAAVPAGAAGAQASCSVAVGVGARM